MLWLMVSYMYLCIYIVTRIYIINNTIWDIFRKTYITFGEIIKTDFHQFLFYLYFKYLKKCHHVKNFAYQNQI